MIPSTPTGSTVIEKHDGTVGAIGDIGRHHNSCCVRVPREATTDKLPTAYVQMRREDNLGTLSM